MNGQEGVNWPPAEAHAVPNQQTHSLELFVRNFQIFCELQVVHKVMDFSMQFIFYPAFLLFKK
jgi:hypothetical protein